MEYHFALMEAGFYLPTVKNKTKSPSYDNRNKVCEIKLRNGTCFKIIQKHIIHI